MSKGWAFPVNLLAWSQIVFAASGCGYIKDRLLDASDVLDLKYGTALGLGAKVETSLYLGGGLGLAMVNHQRE